MRRRDALVIAASALSGCLGSSGGSPTRSPPQTPESVPERATTSGRTTTPPPETVFPRHVAVEAVTDGRLRETFDVGADVSVLDGQVTAGDTARLELALRTTTDTQRSLTYDQRYCGRNEFRTETNEFGLFLFPSQGEWGMKDIECPVVSNPNLDCGIPVVEETITVPASGALTWRYDLLVPPRNLDRGGCVVTSEYRFTRSFRTGETTATLSFTLSITDT